MRPLERWQTIVDRMDAGELPPPEDRAWFVARYRAALRHGLSLDRAYGFQQHGGSGGLARQAALARRDGLLRELHRVFYHDLPPRRAASEIIALATRRTRGTRTPGGARDALMDAVILCGERVPGLRQLATILARPAEVAGSDCEVARG